MCDSQLCFVMFIMHTNYVICIGEEEQWNPMSSTSTQWFYRILQNFHCWFYLTWEQDVILLWNDHITEMIIIAKSDAKGNFEIEFVHCKINLN